MSEMDLKNSWTNQWASKVNEILINLTGKGLGYIPLENILDDIFHLEKEDMKKLIPYMILDGLTIKISKFQRSKEKILIYIKW